MPELRKISAEELARILESHRHWWKGEKEGQRADLREADLQRADLQGAYLREADLQGAYLREAKISWRSHALLSELLWRAAGDQIPRQMLAAWVGQKIDWCWEKFLAFDHPEREWALDTLAAWVQEGDAAPEELKERAAKLKEKASP